MFGKAVGHSSADSLVYLSVTVDIHIPEPAEWPQIVYPAHVVVMLVRQQYGIYSFKRQIQRLLSEIGPAVEQYAAALGFYKDGCP